MLLQARKMSKQIINAMHACQVFSLAQMQLLTASCDMMLATFHDSCCWSLRCHMVGCKLSEHLRMSSRLLFALTQQYVW